MRDADKIIRLIKNSIGALGDSKLRPSDRLGMVAGFLGDIVKELEKTRTIGQAIDDLLLEHGRGSIGLYILEQAYIQAHTGAPHNNVHIATIDGKTSGQQPRKKALMEEERAIFARLKTEGVL